MSLSASDADRTQVPGADGGAPATVAKTLVKSAYPTTAGVFYYVQAYLVTGAEIKGDRPR